MHKHVVEEKVHVVRARRETKSEVYWSLFRSGQINENPVTQNENSHKAEKMGGREKYGC